jgi:hypothetical protein
MTALRWPASSEPKNSQFFFYAQFRLAVYPQWFGLKT